MEIKLRPVEFFCIFYQKNHLRCGYIVINYTMTKDMSTMTTENLKSYIVADRMTVLNAIAKDCAGVSTKDAANWLKSFSQRVEGYMAISMPEVADKKRKKKVMRFRKISPYLAFCANYRDSKRVPRGDPKGVLKENVLEITKQAGALWKKMSDKERTPWTAKADELTAAAKIVWDKKMSKESITPTTEAIREMKKSDLSKIIEKHNVVIPAKASLKDTRELVVAYFYPPTSRTPTQDQIVKMKKTELSSLIEKAGLSAKKDTKAMQAALIGHYYP